MDENNNALMRGLIIAGMVVQLILLIVILMKIKKCKKNEGYAEYRGGLCSGNGSYGEWR